MSTILLEEQFDIAGVPANVTSVKLSNAEGTAGVIRNDTGATVVADGVDMVNIGTGLYRYEFTEPAAGLTYTYWVEWVYAGETYRDEKTYTSAVRSNFHATAAAMDKPAIVEWLRKQFQPLTLATPLATLNQIVDNSVRYWNTHSGYKVTAMVLTPASGARVQVSDAFKTVVQVTPSSSTTWIWNDHPLWTMMGIQVMDNVTGDLIMMSEAFRSYRIYVGSDMRWMWQAPDEGDPTVGGYIAAINVPRGSTHLRITGTLRIRPTDTIKAQPIIDWITQYAQALLKQIEGNTLRKAEVIDLKTDGAEMIREGKEEQKDLKEELGKDSRWVVLMRRS